MDLGHLPAGPLARALSRVQGGGPSLIEGLADPAWQDMFDREQTIATAAEQASSHPLSLADLTGLFSSTGICFKAGWVDPCETAPRARQGRIHL